MEGQIYGGSITSKGVYSGGTPAASRLSEHTEVVVLRRVSLALISGLVVARKHEKKGAGGEARGAGAAGLGGEATADPLPPMAWG